jgi:hypothetical protein
MRARIVVDFLPAASFGLALRRGTGAFAARPYRQRAAGPWLLDQPLPPDAGAARPHPPRAGASPHLPWPPAGGLWCESRAIDAGVGAAQAHRAPEGIFGSGMKLAKHPAFGTLMGLRAVRQFLAAQPPRMTTAPLRSAEVSHPGRHGAEVPGQADPGGSGTAQEPVRQKNIVLP